MGDTLGVGSKLARKVLTESLKTLSALLGSQISPRIFEETGCPTRPSGSMLCHQSFFSESESVFDLEDWFSHP